MSDELDSDLVVEIEQPGLEAETEVLVVEVLEETAAGPKGDPGSDGGSSVEHVQSAPSASWIIPVPPGMGRTPAVTVYDASGQLVLTDVHADPTSVNVVFPAPATGSAVLS